MLLRMSISSREAYLQFMDNPSSRGEMKDLGLLAEIMACAIAVHLLSETVRLLPLQSNKIRKKRFRELGINFTPFSVVSSGSFILCQSDIAQNDGSSHIYYIITVSIHINYLSRRILCAESQKLTMLDFPVILVTTTLCFKKHPRHI